MAVGLQMVLTESPCGDTDSNIVMKYSLLRSTKAHSLCHAFLGSSNRAQCCSTCRVACLRHYDCFLKSCFLCNKILSLDKDVYMYRGDQGFCSEECRSRQIYIDEMKELELSTVKTLASIRAWPCHDSNGGALRPVQLHCGVRCLELLIFHFSLDDMLSTLRSCNKNGVVAAATCL